MTVEFRRPEYNHALPIWRKVDDIVFGENLSGYLREFTAPGASQSAVDRAARRTREYRESAVFYAISGYTFRGMIGAMFRKDPKLDLPASLEYLATNADGAGNSIYQQAQSLAGDVTRKGRAAVFVSFPPTEGDVSRADMQTGGAVATIHAISPEQVINWRTDMVGGQSILSLVVFSFLDDKIADDGFGVEHVVKYRHLAIEEGVYVDRTWAQSDGSQWQVEREFIPRDGSGSPWREIPFQFVGSENNDTSVDPAPMLDLVRVNIGHFRNSAELEDSIAIAGQAQPWASGVDDAWMRSMQQAEFQIGSRVLLPLPEGGQFGFASADPNPIARQGMMDKVELMVGLGARFIQPGGAVKTATQAESENEIQHSVLSLIAANVSESYTRALQWAARYMNAPEGASIEINRDYGAEGADPQELTAMVASWVQGAIPSTDLWAWLQARGLISPDKTLEEIEREMGDPPDMVI